MSPPRATVRYPALEKAERARAARAKSHTASHATTNDTSMPWPAPLRPPAEWFELPSWLAPSQRLTIDNDGRVYGYLFDAGAELRKPDGSVFRPGPSPSGYRIAHRGEVECSDGRSVAVATVGVQGHAELSAKATEVEYYYDDPTAVRAVVRLQDTEHGCAFAGAITPGTSVAHVLELRRSSLSGDWRARTAAELARLGATDVEGERAYDLVGIGVVRTPGIALASVTDLPVTPEPGVSPEGAALTHMRASVRGVRAGMVVWARFAVDRAHRQADAQSPEVVAAVHLAKSALDFVAQLDEIIALPEEPVVEEPVVVEEPEVAQA